MAFDPTRSPLGHNVPAFPSNADALTPNDTVGVDSAFHVYVGGGGDVTIVPADKANDGDTRTFKNVPAGAIVPCMARWVVATGTTATDLLKVY